MKIVDVRTTVACKAYGGEARNTRHAWKERNYVFVSVETDGGVSGLGEMYCDGHGSTAVAELTAREEVKPVLVGEDPLAIARIRHRLGERMLLSGRGSAHAPLMSAVDIALWDLLGRIAGLPLRTLLGGFSDRVPVYGSGGMYAPGITPESLGDDMRKAVARGLGGVKVKVGGGAPAEDAARIAAVRRAIGPDARLMADAMFSPSLPQAMKLAELLRPYDLHFLEAPTAAADLAGWARVRDACGIPLSGPELESSVDLMRDYLDRDLVAYLQFDVMLAGGLSAGRDLAALAAAHHRSITLHAAGSAVGLAASAHLGAAVSNCDSLEFHLFHQGFHDRLWASGWTIDRGHLVIPDRPGLGIDLDFDDIRSGRALP